MTKPVQSIAEGWIKEWQASFEAQKTKLKTAPVLAYTNFNFPFILEVDVSNCGLGELLSE